MKRTDLVFTAALVPIDFLMLVVAGVAAYFLRFQTLSEIRPVIFAIPFSSYLVWVLGLAVWYIFVFLL